MSFVCYNGQFFPSSQPLLTASNPGFKWGDGIFETMKYFKGRILLETFHFDRLFTSLRLLQINAGDHFNSMNITSKLQELCRRNQCESSARIRLAVYRNEKNEAEWLAEAIDLGTRYNRWEERGGLLGIFPLGRKAMDVFSNLKSASFQAYILATLHAKAEGWDDALVLNNKGAIADSSRANIFLIREDALYTPALTEGCINGVCRRFVVEEAKKLGYPVHQQELKEEDLLEADEVFLTNAIQGMRWIKTFRDKEYSCAKTKQLYEQIILPLFS